MTARRPVRLALPLRKLSFPLVMAAAGLAVFGLAPLGGADSLGADSLSVEPEPVSRLDGLVASLSSLDVLAELARLAAMALAGYLVALTVAFAVVGFVAARLSARHERWHRIVGRTRATLQRVTPRFLVTILASSILSTGVASASQPGTGPSPTPASDRAGSAPPTMELVTPDADVHTEMPWGSSTDVAVTTPPSTAPPAIAARVATELRKGAEDQTVEAEQATTEARNAAESQTAADVPTHRVAPGEHLWSIAEDAVRARSGDGVQLKDIGAYWSDLISLNRDRLADPDNPDLILPGQELDLPT